MEKIELTYQTYKVAVYHQKGTTDEKVIFLHGGALDNAMMSWKEVIERMGTRYDIYAPDLIGFGESDKPAVEYSIPMFVEFLYGILRQLKIEKTALAGLSMGGGIAIAFALKYPQMVKKLVLADSLGLYQRMPFHRFCHWYVNSSLNAKSYEWMAKSRNRVKWAVASALFGDKNKVSEELVTQLYHLVRQPNNYKAWKSFQRYELGKDKLTTDLAPRLSELKMPVLIVNGEKDSAVPVKSAVRAGKIIPDCRLCILKGCRHWAQKERPEEFTEALNQFLSQEEKGGAR